jgi:hypothetical protein
MRTPLQDVLSEGLLDVASVFEDLDSVLEAVDIVADSLLTVCRVGIEPAHTQRHFREPTQRLRNRFSRTRQTLWNLNWNPSRSA